MLYLYTQYFQKFDSALADDYILFSKMLNEIHHFKIYMQDVDIKLVEK